MTEPRWVAVLEQMRDPVLAAEEDALEVGVLDALPGGQRGLQDRVVVGRGDPRIVEQHVDLAEFVANPLVERDHRLLIGEVALERQLSDGMLEQVDADDAGALGRESVGGGKPDASGSAGDHAHLSVKATHVIAK